MQRWAASCLSVGQQHQAVIGPPPGLLGVLGLLLGLEERPLLGCYFLL